MGASIFSLEQQGAEQGVQSTREESHSMSPGVVESLKDITLGDETDDTRADQYIDISQGGPSAASPDMPDSRDIKQETSIEIEQETVIVTCASLLIPDESNHISIDTSNLEAASTSLHTQPRRHNSSSLHDLSTLGKDLGVVRKSQSLQDLTSTSKSKDLLVVDTQQSAQLSISTENGMNFQQAATQMMVSNDRLIHHQQLRRRSSNPNLFRRGVNRESIHRDSIHRDSLVISDESRRMSFYESNSSSTAIISSASGQLHSFGKARNIEAPLLSRANVNRRPNLLLKFNSCSSLFVKTTVSDADLGETLNGYYLISNYY